TSSALIPDLLPSSLSPSAPSLPSSLLFLTLLVQVVQNIHGPHLIVVPKSTLPNWLKEFEHWVPDLRVFGIIGTYEERVRLPYSPPRPLQPRLGFFHPPWPPPCSSSPCPVSLGSPLSSSRPLS